MGAEMQGKILACGAIADGSLVNHRCLPAQHWRGLEGEDERTPPENSAKRLAAAGVKQVKGLRAVEEPVVDV